VKFLVNRQVDIRRSQFQVLYLCKTPPPGCRFAKITAIYHEKCFCACPETIWGFTGATGVLLWLAAREKTMKIKLVAIDLDGTLLTSWKQITPETEQVIEAVRRERSVHVVLTTARPPRTTMPFYEQLKLDGPMINYNGALVWAPPTGVVLLHQPIPLKIARGIIKWARQRFTEIRVSAEIGDKWYTDYYDGTYQTETARMQNKPDIVAPIEKWLTQPVTKLLLLGNPAWLNQVSDAIAEDLPNKVATVQTEDYLLQIMHGSVSKVNALTHVAAEYNIPRVQVMAIGDNANDAGMIRWAGVGVAMANGHVACLQVADHLADHNDEDGVANVLRDIVIEGREPQGA